MSESSSPVVSPIKILDTNPELGLTLYHYTKDCSATSPEEVRNCRGNIYQGDGDNKKLVCKTYGYPLELFSDDVAGIHSVIDLIFNDCVIFTAEEGTFLRVWWYQASNSTTGGSWMISSHKRINAFTSFWGSKKSHGELLQEALWMSQLDKEVNTDAEKVMTNWLNSLDKTRLYAVLVRTTSENRVVCNPRDDIPCVFSVAEFDPANGFEPYSFDINTSSLPRLSQLKISSPDKLIEYAQSINPSFSQGILLYHNNNPIRITNRSYAKLADLRSNTSSLQFRYFQVRSTPQFQDFLVLYAERSEEFNYYETLITRIIQSIHQGLVKRFLQGKYTVLPGEQWKIASVIKTLQDTDPTKYTITSEDNSIVKDYVNSLQPAQLAHLVNCEMTRLS